jgi:hypothetical protein
MKQPPIISEYQQRPLTFPSILIRVGNLILATLFLCVCLYNEAGCHSALQFTPPRPHHGPITIREIVMDSIVLIWFAGAVGLFSRRRLAWVGSLVGAGALVCSVAILLTTAVGMILFPDARMVQDEQQLPTGIYMFGYVTVVCQFLVFLAVSLGLFIGLLRMRKELR